MYSRFFMVLLALFLNYAEAKLPAVDDHAISFINIDANNKHVSLRDYLGNDPKIKKELIAISFWGISCIPCRTEMPILDEWALESPEKVKLFFINVDSRNQMPQVHDFLKKHELKSETLFDYYQTTAKNYGVCSGNQCKLPSLFIIDTKSAKIKYVQEGYNAEEDLKGILSSILTGKPIETAVQQKNEQLINFVSKDKYLLLHKILINLPHEQIAEENNLTKAQLIEIFKEVEKAAEAYWNES